MFTLLYVASVLVLVSVSCIGVAESMSMTLMGNAYVYFPHSTTTSFVNVNVFCNKINECALNLRQETLTSFRFFHWSDIFTYFFDFFFLIFYVDVVAYLLFLFWVALDMRCVVAATHCTAGSTAEIINEQMELFLKLPNNLGICLRFTDVWASLIWLVFLSLNFHWVYV